MIQIEQMPYQSMEMYQLSKDKGNIDFRPHDQVLSAQILERKNNKYHLYCKQNDFHFQADADSVKGSVGDTVYFSLVSTDDKTVTLKQILGNSSSISLNQRVQKDLLPQELHLTSQKRPEINRKAQEMLGLSDEKEKIRLAAMRIKQKLLSGLEGINLSVVHELAGVGLSLQHMTGDMIAAAVGQVESTTGGLWRAGNGCEEHIRHMVQHISQLSEREIVQIIGSNRALTLDNIYQEKFKTPAIDTDEGVSIELDSLRSDLLKILEAEELPVNDENQKWAELLLKHDLPVLGESIKQMQWLENMVQNLDSEALVTRAIENKKEGKSPGDLLLYQVYEKKKAGLVQHQMLEEASVRLHNQNLVNTDKVKEYINDLNEQEKQLKLCLAIVGVDDQLQQEQHLATLLKIEEGKKYLPQLHHSFYASLIKKEISSTLSTVLANQHFHLQKRQEGYEAKQTVFSPRYGDSINDLDGDIEQLLQSNGLVLTEENKKVAYILLENKMELTVENIEKTRGLHRQIIDVAERFHPLVGAEMLKKGYRPLEMNFDDLLDYVDQFEKEYGLLPRENMSFQVYQMKQNDSFDEQTKEQILDIYRLFYQLSKHSSQIIGHALQTESGSMHLKHLMEVAKNREKSNVVDVSVTKEMGMLSNRERYYQSIIGRIEKNAHALALQKTMEDEPEYLVMPLEKFDEHLAQTRQDLQKEIQASIAEYDCQWVGQVKMLSPQVIAYAVENRLPLDIQRLQTIRVLQANPKFIGQEMKRLGISCANQNLLHFGDCNSYLENLEEALQQKQFANNSQEEQDALALCIQAVQIQKALSASGKPYRIPVAIGEEQTDIHLHIEMVNGETQWENEANIQMSLETEKLGTISVQITLKNDAYFLQFRANRSHLTKALNANYKYEELETKKVHLHGQGAGQVPEHVMKLMSSVTAYLERF